MAWHFFIQNPCDKFSDKFFYEEKKNFKFYFAILEKSIVLINY